MKKATTELSTSLSFLIFLFYLGCPSKYEYFNMFALYLAHFGNTVGLNEIIYITYIHITCIGHPYFLFD